MGRLRIFLLLQLMLIMHLSSADAQQKIEQWDRFELPLHYSYKGNGFTDINLSAAFTNKDTSIAVSGFYDGNNIFKIRFMPVEAGIWYYTTSSNIPELNNKKGSFECVKASGNNQGIVRVSDIYNFKYADGKHYYPFGTTAYAWLFNLPYTNADYKSPQEGTRYKIEIIDTWAMTITEYPKTFEATKEIDYRVYDKDFGKVRLPLKPYIALRITKVPSSYF